METEENELKQMQKKPVSYYFFRPQSLIVIIGAILLVLSMFTDFWGFMEYKKLFIAGMGLIILGIIAGMSTAWLKNKTSKIIWENGHSTTTGRYNIAGNFMLLRLGGIRVQNFPEIQGSQGTIIFPLSAINKIGENYVLRVTTDIRSYDELPLEVQEEVDQRNLPSPFMFGMCSETQLLKEMELGKEFKDIIDIERPDVQYIKTLYLKQNKILTELDKVLKGDFGRVQNITGALARIQSKAHRGEPIKEKLKRHFLDSEENQ